MKIVTMPNRGQVKEYTVAWGNKAKVYTQDGRQVTRSRDDIQAALTTRAEELAVARGYSGVGRFERLDYERALAEISPADRAMERNLGPITPEEVEVRELEVWQAANPHAKDHAELRHLAKQAIEKRRAYLHQDQAAAMLIRQGKARSLREAFAMANAAAPDIAKLAGLPIEQDYGAGPAETSHEAALRASRAALVRQVAASALQRGISQPDGHERDWIDSWYGTNLPPPPPVARTDQQAAMDAYNARREQFVEGVLQDARRALADPAERAKLKPTRLGG